MAPRAAARLESLGFENVLEYTDGKLDWMAAGLPVEGDNSARGRAGTVARKDVPTCSADEKLDDVRDRLRAGGWDAAVVVDDDRIVIGLLRADDLAKVGAVTVAAAMTSGPSTFRPYVPIAEMAGYMTEHDLDSSPVTTSDGRLVGLLYRSDAIREAGEG